MRRWALRAWNERKSIKLDEKHLHGEAVGAILSRAAHEYLDIGSYGLGSAEFDLLPHDSTPDQVLKVFLAIGCMGEALSSVAKMSYGGYYLSAWQENLWLKRSLMMVGWCPYEVNRMLSSVQVMSAGAFYLSHISPRRVHKDHVSCSESHCDADQIEEQTYLTKHVSTNCGCPFPIEDTHIAAVRRFASKGTVSTYTVVADPTGHVNIRVRPIQRRKFWRRETMYVAISHVWSDGLGNPRRPSLPLQDV